EYRPGGNLADAAPYFYSKDPERAADAIVRERGWDRRHGYDPGDVWVNATLRANGPDYGRPEVRLQNRPRLIERWFRALQSEAGDDVAGLVLSSWEDLMLPDEWWQSVLDMVRLAPEDCLGHVAAGPLEGLLSRYGEEVIDWVEAEARADPKFLRA